MHSLGRDIKAETLKVFALTSTSLTAGGGGDNTEITGATIDRQSYTKAESAEFILPCRAVLAAGKKLTVTGLVEDSANGSSWATYLASATLLTLLDSGSGSTLTGVARMGIDLNGARRYIRCKATPDLDASGTDTAVVGAGTCELAGLQVG